METKHLIIRPIKHTDLDAMYAYVSNEEVMKYERDAFTYEGLKKLFERYVDEEIFYACMMKENNQMIGHYYLGRTFPQDFQEFSLGYIFHPDYQGKGYCTEGAKELVRYAFKQKNAHRITAKCNPDNIASWRVMEKVGFKREGCLRERAAFKKDQQGHPIFTDELVYGLLIEDLLQNEC